MTHKKLIYERNIKNNHLRIYTCAHIIKTQHTEMKNR